MYATAYRATVRQARDHFHAGGAVLVADNLLHRRERLVGPLTGMHTRHETTWAQLAAAVKAWGRPQRYYTIPTPCCRYCGATKTVAAIQGDPVCCSEATPRT